MTVLAISLFVVAYFLLGLVTASAVVAFANEHSWLSLDDRVDAVDDDLILTIVVLWPVVIFGMLLLFVVARVDKFVDKIAGVVARTVRTYAKRLLKTMAWIRGRIDLL